MAPSTRTLISAGFGASLLLICAIGLLSYWALTELVDANEWVEHSYQVLGALDDFHTSLLAAEESVNNVTASRQHPSAELFGQSSELVRRRFSRLQSLTADNASQQERLNLLGSLIAERLNLLEETIRLRTAPHPDVDHELALTNRGTDIMGRIHSIVIDMKAEEEGLLSNRNQATRADAHRVIVIIILTILAALLLALVATISVNRNISRREKAEEKARRHSRRREVLRGIDQAILSAHSLTEIAETVLDRIRDLLPYQQASVLIFEDPEQSEGRVIAARGDEGTNVKVGNHIPPEAFGDIQELRKGHICIKTDDAPGSDPAHPRPSHSLVSVPLIVDDSLVGMFRLGNERQEVFTPDYVDAAGELAASLAVAFQGALLLERLKTANDRLETMSRRLLDAEENERRRLAQDLHDELGQTLTVISLRLQLLGKRLGDTELANHVSDSIEILHKATDQVRSLALNLRPPSLDDLGLVKTLSWYVEHQAQWTELTTHFTADPPEISLPPDLETTCFRVVQEALTNAMRYARARRLDVGLRRLDGEVELLIQDDGVGFNVEATMKRAEAGSGFGLLGMDERVRLAGGRFIVESAPGSGTVIRARFSVPH